MSQDVVVWTPGREETILRDVQRVELAKGGQKPKVIAVTFVKGLPPEIHLHDDFVVTGLRDGHPRWVKLVKVPEQEEHRD